MRFPKGNTIITEDFHVLGGDVSIQIPGCICAFYSSLVIGQLIYAVVHEDYKTKILLSYKTIGGYEFDTILEINGLIDIVNISKSEFNNRGKRKYIFSTAEGVILVLDERGRRVELSAKIPTNSVVVTECYAVSFDGKVSNIRDDYDTICTLKGYQRTNVFSRENIGYTDHDIIDMSLGKIHVIFHCWRDIEDVFIHESTNRITTLMILSEGIIYYNIMDCEDAIKSGKLEGEWSSVPFYIMGDVCAIDCFGVIRDIRTAWKNYNEFEFIDGYWRDTEIPTHMLYSTDESLYEQGVKFKMGSISVYHGMRVFTRRNIKSAHSIV